MRKARKRTKGGVVTAALRRAIRDSGLSQSEIARRAEIDVGMVNRFLHGSRGMTLAMAERLAAALELELRVVKARRDKKGE